MSNSNSSNLTIVTTHHGAGSLTFDFKVEKNNVVLGSGYSFLWSFGDGEESELPQPTHTYTSTAEMEVSVQVNTEDPREGTDGAPGTSTPPPPPESAVKKIFPS